jgi:hypothetical protein
MKKTLLIMLISFILLSITASADSFFPIEPSEIMLDNNIIFYMTPPHLVNDEHPPTGLYYNTDPLENIYLVSSDKPNNPNFFHIYFADFNVRISDDGMYFVHFPITWRKDGVPSEHQSEVALEFYAEGKLIKRYKVSNLVKDKDKLKFSVSMITWNDWVALPHLNADNNTLTLTTIDEITYTFDITTGDIIKIKQGSKYAFIITIISAVVICISTSAFLIRRKKWKKKDFKN